MLHRSQHHRGFTFIELMMGIIVTALVLSALGVFVFGVADAWTSSESAQSVFLSGNMAVDHIDRIIREASMIDPDTTTGSLDNSGSPAACMFWHDDNGDGQIQFSEMSLLQYSPTAKTISVYAMPTPTTPAEISAANAIESQLLTPMAFMNSAYVAPTVIAHNITGCEFLPAVASSIDRPSLEVIMNVGDAQAQTTIYTTATVRCPNENP